MAQNLEFSATQGMTLTAIARAIGTYSGGTAADTVTGQAGTDRYVAAFAVNLPAGTYRLDYLRSGVPFGSEIYEVNGNGTYQPRSEQAGAVNVTVLPLAASQTLRIDGTNIRAKVRETSTVGFTVEPDENGDTPTLDPLVLEIKIESLDKLVTHTIPNADIARTGASFSFKLLAAVTLAPREWTWSLRETTDKSHLCGGLVVVTYAP